MFSCVIPVKGETHASLDARSLLLTFSFTALLARFHFVSGL